jgi:NodT family efflux transporter outer membrane factor (OMF) lipoprotein
MKLLQYVRFKSDFGFRARDGRLCGKLSGSLSALTCASILSACAVGPNYVEPSAPVPATFKERKGWHVTNPSDMFDRGPWWEIFKDPTLNNLMAQVEISNQTVIQDEANYRQAVSLIREAQASFFPTVSASYTATASHTPVNAASGFSGTALTYNPMANATWAPDVWGKIRRTVESNSAAAQFSAAELANAKLLEQAALATAYYDMRAAEALKILLDDTAKSFQRALDILRAQHQLGTATAGAEASEEALLKAAQAQAIGTEITRAQSEHAIAVLIGRPPAELDVKRGGLANWVPVVPPVVPSALLERRPDIAGAERQLQEFNASVGVAVANFYPDITLSGSFGFLGPAALPIMAANEAWTLAGSASQTIFDGGLLSSQLAAAKATYEGSVANYRQTVLTAFQQVEDQLVAQRVLAPELRKQREAIAAARKAVEVDLNQYQAGTVAFTAVITDQLTLLGDEETALTIRQDQFLAVVSLVQALGGGWDKSQLPNIEELKKVPTLTPPL